MSNSPLVSYTRISPNRNSPRKQPIRKITLHHMAGSLSLPEFGALVARTSRQMSANYAIDKDGNIGLFCPEADRSWCSSSPENDHQAITVEIANDGGAPDWHVSDAALEAAVQLCVDVCRRNGMPGLTWTGDSNGTLTCHYMFAATACPGPYLKSKMAWIAEEVNRRLTQTETPAKLQRICIIGQPLEIADKALALELPVDAVSVTVIGPASNGDAMTLWGMARADGGEYFSRYTEAAANGNTLQRICIAGAGEGIHAKAADLGLPVSDTPALLIGPASDGDAMTLWSMAQTGGSEYFARYTD